MVTKSSYELLNDLKTTLQNGTIDDLYALATFIRSLEILFSGQESTVRVIA